MIPSLPDRSKEVGQLCDISRDAPRFILGEQLGCRALRKNSQNLSAMLPAHLLLGHAPHGVSAFYVSQLALVMSPAMREAQRRISADIAKRLGIAVF